MDARNSKAPLVVKIYFVSKTGLIKKTEKAYYQSNLWKDFVYTFPQLLPKKCTCCLKNKCTLTLGIGLEIDLIQKCHDILGQRGPCGFEKVVHNIHLGMLAWVFEFGT